LQEAAALADDIHTSVFPLEKQALLLETYPIRLRRLHDGVYVRAARKDLADLVGTRLEEVEGVPVSSLVSRVNALSPGNARRGHSNVPLAYLLSPATYRYLGILRDGVELRVTVLIGRGNGGWRC
jgi:hypothetical protein